MSAMGGVGHAIGQLPGGVGALIMVDSHHGPERLIDAGEPSVCGGPIPGRLTRNGGGRVMGRETAHAYIIWCAVWCGRRGH